MKTITVNVTSKDIKNGVKVDAKSCALALAFKREYPKAAHVVVGGMFAIIQFNGAAVSLELPEAAKNFIDAFDVGDKVFPRKFDFVVDSDYEHLL